MIYQYLFCIYCWLLKNYSKERLDNLIEKLGEILKKGKEYTIGLEIWLKNYGDHQRKKKDI